MISFLAKLSLPRLISIIINFCYLLFCQGLTRTEQAGVSVLYFVSLNPFGNKLREVTFDTV